MSRITRIARNQLSHDVDLPRVQIRDRLVKFEFMKDSYAQRDVKEIPLEPKGYWLTNIPYKDYLPEAERTYVNGRTNTIG